VGTTVGILVEIVEALAPLLEGGVPPNIDLYRGIGIYIKECPCATLARVAMQGRAV
jgi:hypothetical protein